jgi:hypothetical protein
MRIGNQVSNLVRSAVIQSLLAIGLNCLLIQTVNATLLFSEAFNYTAGAGLGTQVNPSNSVAWNGSNSGLTITNVNLTYSGLADQGGNALLIQNASAGSTVNTYANQTSGQVFYSFLFDPLVANGGNNYFTALNPGTTAPGGSGDAINSYYYAAGQLRLRANPGAATGSTVLTLGTTYFVVMEYDIDNKIASMFLNPTPGAAMPAPYAQITGTSATALADVGFKAQSSTGAFLVDNLLIGTTWADVTPTVIPEPSTLALAVAGIGLMVGMIRRRRD